MARSNEQTKQKPQLLKSSSFSWDKAFFTSDGVLDADELSSIIEGDGTNVKHPLLPPVQEIENSLEAKLFQEIESSTKKFNKIKTNPRTSRHNSPSNNVKSPTTMARISTISKTGKSKSKSDLHSHLSPRKSSPSSPISPRSPSSPSSSIIQRSSRGTSSTNLPRRSSSTNLRRKEDTKSGKSFVNSHSSSPLGLSTSSSSTSLSSFSSSTYKKVNQRSISTGRKATTRALTRDSSATSSLKTGSLNPNGGKEKKIQETKTFQRASSPSRPSRVQTNSSSKGVKNIFLVSPEVLDIKGKLNALKMELNMQKKERCKETKMVPVKIGKSESSSTTFKNSSSKRNNQARRT